MKLVILVLFPSFILCSGESTEALKGSLRINTLPLDLTSITGFVHPEAQYIFKNLSSKDLNHRFIIQALKTSNPHFSRAESLQIICSADLRRKVVDKYANLSIYPITLTFHPDDVSSNLDVFNFIRRVQTVIFEGHTMEQFVIEAKESEDTVHDDTQWSIGMYDPNAAFWAWKQPISVMEVLESDTVTAVNSIHLRAMGADLVIELSGSVTEGDLNWTATRNYKLKGLLRAGLTSKEILLNRKLRNLQNVVLTENRSVLDEISVLAQLEKLESLELYATEVADLSSVAQLSSLKSLDLGHTKVVDVSMLAKLVNLESLDLSYTDVADVSALAQLKNLKSLDLLRTKVVDVSALAQLTNLDSLNLSRTSVIDVSALAQLTNLKSLYLSGSKLLEVGTLREFKYLASLDLGKTNVLAVSALAQLTNLESLNLTDTKVENILALENLTNLKELDLSGTKVSDFAVLGLTNKLSNLKVIRRF
jgi:Leucine-rich repeat (LRR) protein